MNKVITQAHELPDDPFKSGLADYIASAQSGSCSVTDTIQRCLRRVEITDSRLRVFEHLASSQALEQAASLDQALCNGHQPGPLFGVPVGIKDIYSVEGMPTRNGSMHPHQHLNGPEGKLIKALKVAGCIVLGKTRTAEYALGASGINSARGTPVNAWDSKQDRIPGGSSSGSAVAVAAGLCGFALGTDTGGSIRNPACLNGLVGYKPTVRRWATDGIFPLSSTLDSAGPLCRSVADTALIYTVVSGETLPMPPATNSLRLGLPRDYFLVDLDDDVRLGFTAATHALREAGVTLVDIDMPEAYEREHLFPHIVPPELLAQLTVEGFKQARADMDSVTEQRAAKGLDVRAVDYLQALKRQQQLCNIVDQRLTGLDGWLAPTCPFTAMTLDSVSSGILASRALMTSRNTMPVNIFGQTAITLPINLLDESRATQLPVGLQLVCKANEDARLLSIALVLETLLGPMRHADVSGFAQPRE